MLHGPVNFHHDTNQQTMESAHYTTANSASASTANAVATDPQPAKASLLGLPVELLNYIITLAMLVDVAKPDLHTFLSKQRQKANAGPKAKLHLYPWPALARTCTSLEAIVLPIYYGQNTFIFHSPKLAYRWLSARRRGKGEATVRRVQLHFGVTRAISEGPAWKQAALEMFLANGTNVLAISEASSFYVGACIQCQNKLQSEMQRINDRGSDFKFGDERLAALADYFDSRGRVVGFLDGCSICGEYQKRL
jgi:hypothetical protein